MRNLVLLGEKRDRLAFDPSYSPNLPPSGIGSFVRSASTDPNTFDEEQVRFLLLECGTLLAVVGGEDSDQSLLESDIMWTCELSSLERDQPDATWFDVTFLDEANSIACLSHGGTIALVDPLTGIAESVGRFDHGIEHGGWSPDQEILALYTYTTDDTSGVKSATLITMNGLFDVLEEVHVESNVSGSEESESRVSLEWRQDGTKLVVSTVDEADKGRKVRVYERDTLEMIAVGRSEDGSGKIVNNLRDVEGGALAWGGEGVSHVMAAVQQRKPSGKSKTSKTGTPSIVFFEPNGLRHREFKLRLPKKGGAMKVTSLDWNAASDLLAVTITQCDHINQEHPIWRSVVQLWHRSNYHWYCKYEVGFPSHLLVARTVNFDVEKPYRLVICLQNNEKDRQGDDIFCLEWRTYDFCWDVHTALHHSATTCAVVDGDVLNLTPLGKAVIPPPMYAASVSMGCPILGVAHCPPSSLVGANAIRPSLVVHLSDGTLVFVGDDCSCKDKIPSPMIANYDTPQIIAQVSLPRDHPMLDISAIRQIIPIQQTCINDNTTSIKLLAIHSNHSFKLTPSSFTKEHLVEILVEITISSDNLVAKSVSCTVINTSQVETRILRIANWSSSTNTPNQQGPPSALIQLTDGTLLEYHSSSGIAAPLENCEPMLEPCPWICGFPQEDHHPPLIIGLSSRSRLYCGERLLNSATSSFALTPSHNFLCYISLGSISQLRFLPISALREWDPLGGAADPDDQDSLVQGYEPRMVERGSKLVAIVPTSPSVILQLPRGNLEGVHPRALVLPFCMSLIRKREYGPAFDLMRRQKVDFNLIVDMNPARFVREDARLFLKQVTRADYLNLFIACLSDENVTQWKYKIPSWLESEDESPSSSGDLEAFDYTLKVNAVCQTLQDIMLEDRSEATGKDRYLLPILSTFAKQNPPKLEEALSLIRDAALSGQPTPSSPNTLFKLLVADTAQSSIKYLAFLADYPLLFDTALGMYDFHLAKAVARNSQMDPKAYIPMLKRFLQMEEYVARYQVDVQLKRYHSALRNLVRSGEELGENDRTPHLQACMDLIEEEKLHPLGLDLFKNDPNMKRRVMVSLGGRYLKDKKGDEALVVFLAAVPKDLEGAVKAATMCGDWRTFFACHPKGENPEKFKSLAAEVAEQISTMKIGSAGKRDNIACAARILLDYCEDVKGTVEMLISAEMWSESRRIARLHGDDELAENTTDAAACYGESCVWDLEDRGNKFRQANERYGVVLQIQRQVKREGGGLDDGVDDAGSLFSMASDASNASLLSNVSGSSYSSVNSVSSVSSVISAGATSNFSLTGDINLYKHKSKFNKIGKDKKKNKKKKTRKSKKPKKGSQEELKELVDTLKSNCVDSEYQAVIVETIQFLAQVEYISLAKELYQAYENLRNLMVLSQKTRQEAADLEEREFVKKSQMEGNDYEFVIIGCEGEVDKLTIDELPALLHEVLPLL